MRRWSPFTAFLGVAVLAAACATLPPAKPVQDIRTIAGKWEGTVTTPGGPSPYTMTIKEDGSYEGSFQGGTVVGSIRLSKGKILWKSDTSGRTGTYSLHEGEGHRLLVGQSDDGSITARLTPVR